jgi:hypothetical protein
VPRIRRRHRPGRPGRTAGVGQPIPIPRQQDPQPLDSSTTPERQTPWRARCRETGTAGSASGLRKRTGSNPDTAPQADSTNRVLRGGVTQTLEHASHGMSVGDGTTHIGLSCQSRAGRHTAVRARPGAGDTPPRSLNCPQRFETDVLEQAGQLDGVTERRRVAAVDLIRLYAQPVTNYLTQPGHREQPVVTAQDGGCRHVRPCSKRERPSRGGLRLRPTLAQRLLRKRPLNHRGRRSPGRPSRRPLAELRRRSAC